MRPHFLPQSKPRPMARPAPHPADEPEHPEARHPRFYLALYLVTLLLAVWVSSVYPMGWAS